MHPIQNCGKHVLTKQLRLRRYDAHTLRRESGGTVTDFYLAGSTKELERVERVKTVLLYQGHSLTFDWAGAEGEVRMGDGDDTWDHAPLAARDLSQKEVNAVMDADVLILLCPPRGRGLGCYLETGVALGNDIDVWVSHERPGTERDSVFWHHPAVTWRGYDSELMAKVDSGAW